MTSDEWEYLLNTRNNASLLKGVAQVNGVNGLVLLPDDYNWIATDRIIFKSGFTTSANSNVEGYGQYQTFTVDQWSKLEAAGAVFLPATGYRDGSGVYYVQLNGCYWSATEYYNNYAHSLDFYSDVARMSNYRGRYYGLSVRLVKDIERETTTPEEPEDDPQDSNCNQTVMVKGAIKEIYERKEWIDNDDHTLGFYAVADTRNAMSRVNLEVTFINTEYANDTIVYNITTDADGEFNLNAKLYDTWDVYKTTVTVEAKSYLTSITHYYEKWDNDGSKWKQAAQEVRGYYQRNSTQKTLSEDALLIGEAISDILLTFVPDRYETTIRGISYYNSYTGMYYDEQVGGVDTFRSWNPLGW